MDSAFNPEAFLDATTSEVNERRAPLPIENPASADGLYTAVIGDITTGSGIIGKGDKAGQPWVSMVVPLKLEIPQQLQDALGFGPTFTLTDRAFLDLTPQGTLDNGKGKNGQQRTYREATGLNNPGEPFSWRMLTGKVVKVKVTQEMYNGNPVEKVSGIFKA